VTLNQFAAVSDISGLCWYRQLTEGDAPADMVQLVERVFALLSEELGVNPQSLHDGDLLGEEMPCCSMVVSSAKGNWSRSEPIAPLMSRRSCLHSWQVVGRSHPCWWCLIRLRVPIVNALPRC
jgi:hypothetical protein